MRICILHRLPLSEASGTNAAFRETFRHLVNSENEIHFVSFREKDEKLSPKGVKCDYIPLTINRSNEFDKLFKTIIYIVFAPLFVAYKHYFKHRFDIIYCEDNTPIYWFFIKKLTRTKTILRIGDLWSLFMQERKSRVVKIIFKTLYFFESKIMWKSVDKLILLSPALRDYFRSLGIKVPMVIATESIDLTKYKVSKKKNKNKVVICHGFFDDFKRPETLVRAAKRVLDKHPKTQFMFVGGGPSLSLLKSIVKERGISKNVKFTGWVGFERLTDLISKADIGVTVRGKNIANNFIVTTGLLQDLASGIAVVAPDLKATNTLIKSKKNGLLYEPENDKELAEKICYLLENPRKTEKIAKEGNKGVKSYDQKKIAKIIANAILEPF